MRDSGKHKRLHGCRRRALFSELFNVAAIRGKSPRADDCDGIHTHNVRACQHPAYVPARRATRVDPVAVLNEEGRDRVCRRPRLNVASRSMHTLPAQKTYDVCIVGSGAGGGMAAYAFKRKSRDGLGDDWPIAYEDVAPYYDKVDRLIGIFGSKENLPNEPNGVFLPPPKPRCHELLVKQAADRLHITCIPSRLSILTRPLNGRAACHYCGQCNRGCKVNANFTATNVLIAPALATGRLTLVTNAMAREVLVDSSGRATGVAYVDKTTGADARVRAKVVVLAASALETARLLLNSKSSPFPNGLANSSGTVGKYITDTTGTDVGGFIPKMMDHVPHNHDGVGGMHLYMPWWLDNAKLDFPRGYHNEGWGGTPVPALRFR